MNDINSRPLNVTFMTQPSEHSSRNQVEILKDILLRDQKKENGALRQKIAELSETTSQHKKENGELRQKIKAQEELITKLEQSVGLLMISIQDHKVLSEKIAPFIQEVISSDLKKNFPDEYRVEVSKTIEDSQEEIVNVIYPKLDLMIKKFVTQQFQKLKESVDERVTEVKTNMSFKSIVKRIKHSMMGVSRGDEIMSQIDKPMLEELFIIQKHSGILMGHASIKENIDQDVIAGMFTAIRSFMEDAISSKQELEMIFYENNYILLHNLPSYYFAAILTGSISATEKEILIEELNTFAEKHIPFHLNDITEDSFKYLSEKAYTHFFAGIGK